MLNVTQDIYVSMHICDEFSTLSHQFFSSGFQGHLFMFYDAESRECL